MYASCARGIKSSGEMTAYINVHVLPENVRLPVRQPDVSSPR